MKIILKDATEYAFTAWYGLNCIIMEQEVGEAAKGPLADPELTKEMAIDIDGESVEYRNVILDDYTIHDDGYHFHMHAMEPLEVMVVEQQKQIAAQQATITELKDKVLGDVTIILDIIPSRPTNIYRSTATPLTGDETEPVATFDFGDGKAGTYTFTFKRHELPQRFYITKANNAYSLAIGSEYLLFEISDDVSEYHYSDVKAINTR